MKKDHESSEPALLPWRKHPGVVAVATVAALVLILAVIITLSVKTPDGTIVLENLPDDAEVTVDGCKVTVKSTDRKTFEIRIEPGKKHRLEVKTGGVKVLGEEVEVAAGGRKPVFIRRNSPEAPGAVQEHAGDGIRAGAQGEVLDGRWRRPCG